MRAELLELAADLARRGEPFVLATVVRRESYSSAHQGDMALITADGGYHGWLGGNCTQPIVKSEAARALLDGKPRLVSLSPEPERELRAGVVALPMRCHSGGTVDIYLEPVLPAPRLLLYGESPAARALAQLGKAMGYRIETGGAEPAAPARGSEQLYAVVATMGESDEDSIAAALAARPAYLGVVASRKRFAQLRETLLARGLPSAALDSVKNPAGLDIGASLPEEVALSILAEIVQLRRAAAETKFGDTIRNSEPRSAETIRHSEIDPVCGMTVAVATARHRAEHGGRTFYFCNPRCREKFIADPQRYLAPAAAGA
jgi:xanthine dehydrogenase accessory factor